MLTPRSCASLTQLAGQSDVRDGLPGGFWGQKPWSRLAAPSLERRHGRAGEDPPVQLPAPLQGKHPPAEELLLIRRGNDLLLGQGRRVKCFCSPGRYPALNDAFSRTGLKVAATEGLKKPRSRGGRRSPGASPIPDGPTGSGLRLSGATGGPLCPAPFPVTPTPLQGAHPSPVSHIPQNDRKGQRVCSPAFTFLGKIPLFPALAVPSPSPTSFLMEKERSRRGPWAGPRQRAGYGKAAVAARGWRCPQEQPRGVPADVPRPRPASDPPQARARRRPPGHRAPELEPVPAACAAHNLFRKVSRA